MHAIDEIEAAVEASEGRLVLEQTPDGWYRIRSIQGHTGNTVLADLGPPLGTFESWMLHATRFSFLASIWANGLRPHGAGTAGCVIFAKTSTWDWARIPAPASPTLARIPAARLPGTGTC